MLFNSYAFLLGFLPATWLLYYLLSHSPRAPARAGHVVLVAASLLFYAWWSLRGLGLLLVLMAANCAVAAFLVTQRRSEWRKAVLILGLAGNLGVLGYFKYANFFLENVAALTGTQATFIAVALPLGISFFTFQKIALLVDAYRGEVASLDPLGFMLFVSFFPQLIAGPIVHHAQIMPQFRHRLLPTAADINAGTMLFTIGLAKKVLLADTAATWANQVFSAAQETTPGVADAWGGALAYTLQLYFDFSGYCDMALGAAMLFGIRQPMNFNSPYKAASISDFWRRWHMTLSRFLRDYLYIPLGGNRGGPVRHGLNLLLTMLLGGIWHGAGWTFVAWGALHGGLLLINHSWRALTARFGWRPDRIGVARYAGQMATFLAVVCGWVVFRAADLDTATAMFQGMFAGRGSNGLIDGPAVALLTAMLAVVWMAPNSMELIGEGGKQPLGAYRTVSRSAGAATSFAAACGLLLATSLASLSRVSEFLYFQF